MDSHPQEIGYPCASLIHEQPNWVSLFGWSVLDANLIPIKVSVEVPIGTVVVSRQNNQSGFIRGIEPMCGEDLGKTQAEISPPRTCKTELLCPYT